MYLCLFHALGEQREIYAISVESGWYHIGPAATNGYRDAVGIVLIPEGQVMEVSSVLLEIGLRSGMMPGPGTPIILSGVVSRWTTTALS